VRLIFSVYSSCDHNLKSICTCFSCSALRLPWNMYLDSMSTVTNWSGMLGIAVSLEGVHLLRSLFLTIQRLANNHATCIVLHSQRATLRIGCQSGSTAQKSTALISITYIVLMEIFITASTAECLLLLVCSKTMLTSRISVMTR
jgi:hypothetical protein